jgi:hypothetical protein
MANLGEIWRWVYDFVVNATVRGVRFTVTPRTAPVIVVLSRRKPAHAGNLEPAFLCSSTWSILFHRNSRSADLKLLHRPRTFRKYFSPRDRVLLLTIINLPLNIICQFLQRILIVHINSIIGVSYRQQSHGFTFGYLRSQNPRVIDHLPDTSSRTDIENSGPSHFPAWSNSAFFLLLQIPYIMAPDLFIAVEMYCFFEKHEPYGFALNHFKPGHA